MLSKNKIKLIKSLDTRKGRKREGLFVAEGHRLVGELIQTLRPAYIAATEEGTRLLNEMSVNSIVWEKLEGVVEVISKDELCRASLLQTPQDVIALFPIPEYNAYIDACARQELCLALDGIQDPGNLGTIVRLADWFGIHDIFCSTVTADIFNPKAVQATMGALARVRVHYIDLLSELQQLPSDVPIFGTALDGTVIWDAPLATNGVVVMGNEGNGITPEVSACCSQHLLIPRFPVDAIGTESLNVAMATGIVLSEFRRRSVRTD